LDKAITVLQDQLQALSAGDGLQYIANQFGPNATFSTSFGIEDQVITHLIATQNLPISTFTLDTGRLFPETYSTWDHTIAKYKLAIHTYYPDADQLQDFITQNGPNSFYESVDNRKTCCAIRKVQPLKKALKGKAIWITGIRAQQSTDRQMDMNVEWDATNNIIKYHPLLEWTFDEVNEFVHQHNIPSNPLHQKGFVSIGCAPCTRAIEPGEDFRAGRWWWEAAQKECGLHTHTTT
jgi:phosphoadenosine phosphosulfate reductase